MKISLTELRSIIRNIINEQYSEDISNISIEDIKEYIQGNNIKQSDLNFRNPNFEFEWEEATRYKIFEVLGRDEYLRRAKRGYIVKTSDIKGKLSNTDLYDAVEQFNNLEEDKRHRFFEALKAGEFERSIAIKLNDDRYDLLAGNTRIVGLEVIGLDQEIWIIDLSDVVKNCLKGKHLDADACKELIELL